MDKKSSIFNADWYIYELFKVYYCIIHLFLLVYFLLRCIFRK
ncbi:hypothetical protein XNC3_2810001 [Xenorhabdus nematophila F1]|nr:hypothetical protein XNC3_2810001 [Xenorhabdus nematophila F1]